jgi:hypothetical protein
MMAGGQPLDPDAVAFLTAAGITDATITTAINTLVIQLKAIGVWTKLKAVYPFVGGTATTHKFNLKNPVDSDAAFRLAFAGGWTHTPNGIQGNGANTFANTFYVPNTECNSQNNSIAAYIRNNVGESKYDMVTSNDAGGATSLFGLISLYALAGNQSFYFNGASLATLVGDSRGLWQGFTDASVNRFYRNSGQIATSALGVNAISTSSLYIGANNGGGTLGFVASKQFAFASMGGTKLTTTEAANYYTAVQSFQTTLNRQV